MLVKTKVYVFSLIQRANEFHSTLINFMVEISDPCIPSIILSEVDKATSKSLDSKSGSELEHCVLTGGRKTLHESLTVLLTSSK